MQHWIQHACQGGEHAEHQQSQSFQCHNLQIAHAGSTPAVWAHSSRLMSFYTHWLHGVCRVWCSQISGPSAVLLGDAAHAVTPVGGQGANAALEDCIFLDHILESTGQVQHTRHCLFPIYTVNMEQAMSVLCHATSGDFLTRDDTAHDVSSELGPQVVGPYCAKLVKLCQIRCSR